MTGQNKGSALPFFTNLQARMPASLAGATGSLQATPSTMQSAALIIYEADKGIGAEISVAQAAQLGKQVRLGASLLLTLSANPGVAPIRLSSILPVIPWTSLVGEYGQYPPRGALGIGSADPTFFNQGGYNGRSVDHSFPLRLVSAVERGQGRYERYAQTISYAGVTETAPHQFWTRSLLNRNWQVRLSADDVGQSPLLVTGLYGAGRVAVFGSSASAVDAWNDGGAFWGAVFKWLLSASRRLLQPAGRAEGLNPAISIFAEATPQRSAMVTIQNSSGSSLSTVLVTRLLTWEGAFISEPAAEAPIVVPAGGRRTIEVPIAPAGDTGYQALQVNDAYQMRLGLLSADGATLLAETRASLDFSPTVRLRVGSGNLYGLKSLFHAPGPDDAPPQIPARMGARIEAYAYPPGSAVQCTVEVSNGVRNIAPEAMVRDEMQPKNNSVNALNDRSATQEKGPTDGIDAYGMWTGQQGTENILSFMFAGPMRISSVVLVGGAVPYRRSMEHNPGGAIIEIDGAQLATASNLDDLFARGYGRARIDFPPAVGSVLRVRLPWIVQRGSQKRLAPWLGDIEIDGRPGAEIPAADGKVNLVLRDVLTGKSAPVLSQSLHLPFGKTVLIQVPLRLPAGTDTSFYSLEAEYSGTTGAAPILSIAPARPLLPRTDIVPPDAPTIGAIVTRGFRNCFKTGTGTAETHGNWEEPDDLIWAYSRALKQIRQNDRTDAARLYVTESNLAHYSTPWSPFCNGDDFFAGATPNLIALMKQQPAWDASDAAVMYHSDRWDSGPQMSGMFQWQTLVAFDASLRSAGGMGLRGRTRMEVTQEVMTSYKPQWEAWSLARYVADIEGLRVAFQQAGKRLVLSAQGVPAVAGAPGATLAKTIQGAADDSTWGMANNSVTLTTGRQLGEMAYNPVWKLSTILQYGFNSNMLGNPQWHAPVGTVEPSRRHCYDRAWRATVRPDGSYGSVYTCGYSSNVGSAFGITENDWQQWWQLLERHSLIAPEAPLGAGLVISTSRREAGPDTWFSGGGEIGEIGEDISLVARTFQNLHEGGISIPFATNASVLGQWQGDAPLIVINLWQFSEAEVAMLGRAIRRGVKVALFASGGTLSPSAAALTLMPGVSTLNMTAAKQTARGIVAVADTLHEALRLPLVFPPGTAGYGFRSGGASFIVVEDWMEQGRIASVKLKATAGATRAAVCQVNEHKTLRIDREGNFWSIEVPLRPGDGILLALKEDL